MSHSRWAWVAAFVSIWVSGSRAANSEPGDLIELIPTSCAAPADIAYDSDDGTYWVTSFSGGFICHLRSDLRSEIGRIDVPFDNKLFPSATGLAFNSLDHTLLVADSVGGVIHELQKDGTPTGRQITAPFAGPESFIDGLSIDPGGNDGLGSIFAVQRPESIIHEFGLDATLLRVFPDRDDARGLLGDGRAVDIIDVDPIFEEERLVGFHALVAIGAYYSTVKLDTQGAWTGASLSLSNAGGDGNFLAGILRSNYVHPTTGRVVDAFILAGA